MNNKIYETKRLYVRSFTKEDIDGNYKDWWTNQEVTKHNSHGLFPYTKAQMENFLARLESSDDIVWAVMAKYINSNIDEGAFPLHIGNISLQNINWINRSAEFTTVFGEKEYWGKGYCTEATKLLFAHGFDKLNLHRIWTGTAVTNIGMRRVAMKLGMIDENVFRDGVFLNGKYVDVYTYGILEDEWRKLSEK